LHLGAEVLFLKRSILKTEEAMKTMFVPMTIPWPFFLPFVLYQRWYWGTVRFGLEVTGNSSFLERSSRASEAVVRVEKNAAGREVIHAIFGR
jgi:hypothetical protein